MENRYRWSSVDVSALREHIRAVDTALGKASTQASALYAEMEGDTTWSGDHKLEFMAWMDLLCQLHKALADESIGAAAVKVLGDFLTVLGNFYDNSALFASLRGV